MGPRLAAALAGLASVLGRGLGARPAGSSKGLAGLGDGMGTVRELGVGTRSQATSLEVRGPVYNVSV